jgi:hypothetical protein
MTPFRYFRPLVVGCALALVALALASEVAASAGPVANVAAGRSAAAILNRCTQYPHPTMPPSTGTQTPTGFTVEMAGAVLAPASAASTLPSAYAQFNDMTCSQYTHKYQESPPKFFYYDCVGFTGYTVRSVDPLAWQSVVNALNLHAGYVPTPLAFEEFFNGLATPQPGWTAVPSVQSIQPGDVLAWQPGTAGVPDTTGTGHSVIPLVAPRAIAGSNGTRWEVVVMDSTAGGHGPEDTRKTTDPLSQRNAPILTKSQTIEPSGLGIGTIAFDTTPTGQVTGVEWNVGDAPESIVFGAGRPIAGSPPGPMPPFTTAGYDLATAAGPVSSFGDASGFGPAGPVPLNAPVVGMTGTIDGYGYWEAAADGGVFAFGDAPFRGSMSGAPLAAPVVGIGNDPNGLGYWLVGADGGVFTFGDSGFYGSMGGQHLVAPIVGITATPDGLGYWLVAADGGVFAFGDAQYFGSMSGQSLVAPIVGIAPMPDGQGYVLVAADGGVFAFGAAGFYGSMGGRHLNAPVVAIATSNDGGGYWEFSSDGGVFAFGDAPFLGSASTPLPSPVVGAIED